MAIGNKLLLAFNRGIISSRGLARIDIARMAMSAETQTNWIPRVLGSMMLRPGNKFVDFLNNGVNNRGRLVPFTFGVDDQALLELTASIMLIIDPLTDLHIVTTTDAPASQLLNTGFGSDISSWTDASQTGGSVTWLVGGYAGMKGDGTDFGILRQTVAVAGGDQNKQHRVLVRVVDGPVRFKVGSTAGDDDYIAEVRLDRGEHSLSFTPGANFTVEFANEREFNVRVTQCIMQNATSSLSLITPWASAADRDNLRWDQSADVMYFAADGVRTQKVERRGDGTSWSVVDYLPEDGPFRVQNVSGITLVPSALIGDITLTASEGIFRQEHADNRSIWRIASQGQTVTKAISGADDFSDAIRVIGKGDARNFGITISGTFVATVTLQFAFADDGPWNDQGLTWTAPVSTNLNDGQDDQIIFYRIGIKTGDYTSGTATVGLNYTGGSIQGVARVIAFTSSTVVTAQVLKDFGAITASKDWWEGEWSDRRGWPTSTTIHEGRLWWAGRDNIWGSISDRYESFDDNFVGDAAPISRSIGSGPIRVIHWLISMGRLLFGTADNSANVAAAKMDGNRPLGARSNSFDEPLSPTNFNIKTISSKAVFVDRSKQRLYELLYNLDQQDYQSLDLSIFAPDFNTIGIVQIAVQMKPDVRIHCVRSDGTLGMLVYDRLENVICWIEITSPGATGLIEDVAILPGVVEDQVYYVVKRTINSLTERHIVKWALESEAIGGQLNKIADSFALYDSTATTTPFTTELIHLRGETVVIWADGKDVGTDTVTAAGALTNPLATAASKVVAGLGYTAQFKSTKLGEINGIGLLERKKVNRLGFIAENLHYQGLQYGPDFSNLSDLPLVEESQVTAADTIHASYHEDNFPFGGEWDTDSRICIQAAAPRPATVLAAIAEFESLEKLQQR